MNCSEESAEHIRSYRLFDSGMTAPEKAEIMLYDAIASLVTCKEDLSALVMRDDGELLSSIVDYYDEYRLNFLNHEDDLEESVVLNTIAWDVEHYLGMVNHFIQHIFIEAIPQWAE